MSFWISLALGLVLLGVVAELVARWVIRKRDRWYALTPNQRLEMRLDREALPSLEPVVRSEINADGERGDPLPAHWKHTQRILVAGGSAAECYLLDQASTWSQVLQDELNRSQALGPERVHVGNISRSLVACDYLTLMLERILPRYERLDCLITFVGASDVVAWLESETPSSVQAREIPLDMCFPLHPRTRFRWSLRGCALRRVAVGLYWKWLKPVGRKSGAGKTIARNRARRAAAERLLDRTPDPAPMLEHLELHFRRLLMLAKGKAKRVLVVRQPWFDKPFTPEEAARLWNFAHGNAHAGQVDTYYTHRLVSELMRAADEVQRRVAEELGVEQLDLMPLLERDFETYYDFLHFTPKGARDVGRAIAKALARRS